MVTVRPGYSPPRKAELGLVLGWGCLVAPVRHTHSYASWSCEAHSHSHKSLPLWGSPTFTFRVWGSLTFTFRVWSSLTLQLPLWGSLTFTLIINKKVDHASSPRPPLPTFFLSYIPKRQYKNEKKATERSHKKFSEHVGMEASKTNQTSWERHHNIYTQSLHLVSFANYAHHKTLYMHLAYSYA